MDPRLSIFLNSSAMMVMGATVVYMNMSALFPKRRSAGVYVSYMLIKGIAWSLYDISYVQGTLGAFEHDFQIIATALFGVLTYIVLYYTWDASIAKIGIGALAGDTLASIATLVIFLLTNALFGTAGSVDYRGYLSVATVFMSAGPIAVYALFLRVFRPIYDWFSAYEFVHQTTWNAIAVAWVAVPTVFRMLSVDQMQESVASGALLAIVMALGLAGHIASRGKEERKRKELLASEVELVKSYNIQIQEQLIILDESAAQLEEISNEIAQIGTGEREAELSDRLASLSYLNNKLRHGIYSDSPALDVILVAAADDMKAYGVMIDFRIPPLKGVTTQAALISREMLAWASQACKAEKERSEDAKQTVLFRIVERAGQLIFVLHMPSNRRRFPKDILARCPVQFDGIVEEENSPTRKTVRVLASCDPATR